MASDHEYEDIDEELYERYLKCSVGTNVYITQTEIPKRFRKVVDACTKHGGELFVTRVDIITEHLSPLAKQSVERIAKRHGFHVECSNRNHQLEYLGSDFGGHYSTDFYRFLQYGHIVVTLAKEKGVHHAYS